MPYTNVDEKVASPKGKVTKKGGIMASTTFAVATMKVAQIPKPGADFEIAEREIPQPTRGQVRIKVQACGIFSRSGRRTAGRLRNQTMGAIAEICRFRVSVTTAATSNSWWPRLML